MTKRFVRWCKVAGSAENKGERSPQDLFHSSAWAHRGKAAPVHQERWCNGDQQSDYSLPKTPDRSSVTPSTVAPTFSGVAAMIAQSDQGVGCSRISLK